MGGDLLGKDNWYLSTWFISLLFACWFLLIPLIVGIYLLILQSRKRVAQYNSIVLENKEKDMELGMKEQELVVRENQVNDLVNARKKEITLMEVAHTQRLELLTNERKEEIALIELEHSQKLEALTKIQKNQFDEMQEKNKMNERQLLLKVQEKVEELEKLELFHKEKLNSITKAKEEALFIRETDLEIREKELKTAQQETNLLNQKIILLRQQLVDLEDVSMFQSFGFYEAKFDLENSDEYKEFLNLVRNKQKEMVRNKMVTIDLPNWNEDKPLRNNTVEKSIKLAVRSFNIECDTVINKVKFYNLDACEKRIRSAFHDLNNLNADNYFLLAEDYLDLKLEELFLAYEYVQKREEEKEEQRRIKEHMREELEAQRQLEEELKILNKEKQHLENAMKHSSQFSEENYYEIRLRLREIELQIEVVDYRVKNTKAGYVYVISNIGSFGEDVYKIGMTRRLEPTDRVRELSGASVPFKYDVHAMIFSKDAPQLEASLHRTFSHRRVNKINERKEFFNVNLDEIRKVVEQNHNAVIEFTMLAEAKEYRETLALSKQYVISS